MTQHETFSMDDATAILGDACALVGLDPAGAELIRLGENGIFRLVSAPVVVRIARTVDYLPDVRKEVAVARWLAAEGVPAVRVVEGIDQPLTVAGRLVTFWDLVVERMPRPNVVDLAGLLRRVHGLTAPSWLPRTRWLERSGRRIGLAPISENDRRFLFERLADLEERLTTVRFTLPFGPIHGDAHRGNLLRGGDGVVLLDFERFAVGPQEWDLLVTAMAYERFGWISAEEYRAFVTVYGGFDIVDSPAYPVLSALQEFKMTTWLMQNVAEDPMVEAEFAVRMRSLRDDDLRREWTPF